VELSPLGNAPVGIGCRSPGTGACAGTLRLRTVRSLSCGGQARPRGAELGAARFRVAVAPSIVPVPLSAPARRLAACARRVRVRATVATAAGAGRSAEFVLRATP
jgi:hypothetical protein